MAREYRYLNANDKAQIEERIPEPAQPAVDDDLRRAWEADHYAHSLLAEHATDPDEKQRHLDAMSTIETALEET